MGWQKVYVTLDSSMESELEGIVWFISQYRIFSCFIQLEALKAWKEHRVHEFHFGIFLQEISLKQIRF